MAVRQLLHARHTRDLARLTGGYRVTVRQPDPTCRIVSLMHGAPSGEAGVETRTEEEEHFLEELGE